VNKGIFTVNRDTPEFSDIAGTLELDRRRFLLKNMKGRFGRSPLTLDGGISDFALPGPSVYSVRMSLEPPRDEIVWLFGKESMSDLRFAGPSTLHLSGTGPADKFAIGADWDLAGAAYAFPKIMEKPKGRPNRLVCDLLLGRERLSVTSFRYDLPPLAVTGSVANLFAAKKPVALKIQAAPFDLAILAELLPALQSYSPAGTCALDITGGGNLDETASFRLRGSLSLTDVSLKPPGDVKPIQASPVGSTSAATGWKPRFSRPGSARRLFRRSATATMFARPKSAVSFPPPNFAQRIWGSKARKEISPSRTFGGKSFSRKTIFAPTGFRFVWEKPACVFRGISEISRSRKYRRRLCPAIWTGMMWRAF
jgi:hypothetical protein